MKTKCLFFAAMAAISMSSCSSTDEIDKSESGSLEMGFSNSRVVGSSSRALEKTSTWADQSKFGVYAMETENAIVGTDFSSDFINDLEVTYQDPDATGGFWEPSATTWWPANSTSKITFFAYHPYVLGEGDGKPVVDAATPGAITLVHNVKPTISEQEDLLFAWVLNAHKGDNDGDGTGAINGGVPFAFKHALTKISFEAMTEANTTINIIGLTMTVPSKATATIAVNGLPNWGAATSAVTYNLLEAGTDYKVTAVTYAEIPGFGANQIMLMIPQTHTDESVITVNYEVVTTGAAVPQPKLVYKLSKTSAKWEQNKHIIYRLKLDDKSIKFGDSTVGDWETPALDEDLNTPEEPIVP